MASSRGGPTARRLWAAAPPGPLGQKSILRKGTLSPCGRWIFDTRPSKPLCHGGVKIRLALVLRTVVGEAVEGLAGPEQRPFLLGHLVR